MFHGKGDSNDGFTFICLYWPSLQQKQKRKIIPGFYCLKLSLNPMSNLFLSVLSYIERCKSFTCWNKTYKTKFVLLVKCR